MRVGSAAAAAVAVLCAAVTAADGASALSGGPPLTKDEVRAEIGTALGRADIHDDETVRLVVMFAESWSRHVPPPECLLDDHRPLPASAEQTDRLLAALGRAGWRRSEPSATVGDGSIVNTSLYRGGWRLTVSRAVVPGMEGPGQVTVGAFRPDC
ncbi:hypothetical protein ACWERV_33545 [Streptomyces sp. NPDC004031]